MDNRTKTLFKFEIKKVIWIFIIAAVIVYITAITSYNSNVLKDYSDLINNSNTLCYVSLRGLYPSFSEINLLWLFALVFFQFSSETNLWHSLPYSQRELNYTKLAVGTLFITLIFLYYTIAELSIYNNYKFIYDELLLLTDDSFALPNGADLFMYTLLVYIIYLFIYYMLVFLQYKSNHRAIGLKFGAAALLIPIMISNQIDMYAHPTLYRYLLIYLDNLNNLLMTNIYSSTYFHISIGNTTYFQPPTYIFYILLTAIFFVLASKGRPYEDTGILSSKAYARIFIGLITVFFGLFGIELIYVNSLLPRALVFAVFGGTAFGITKILLKKQGVKL